MSADILPMLRGLCSDIQLYFDRALLFSLLWLMFYFLDEIFSRLLFRGARHRAMTWRFALILSACIAGFHAAPAIWYKNLFGAVFLASQPSELEWSTYLICIVNMVAVLWVGYAVFGLIQYIFRRCKTANCLRFLPDSPSDDALIKASLEMGISPMCKVWNNVESIAVFGIFSPTMIVPTDFSERYTEHERYYLYLHELAHIRRHDTFFNFCADIWDIVFWIFPPLRWEMRRQREYKELCCDKEVLKQTAVESIRYGELLLREIKAKNNGLLVGFSSQRYIQAKIRLNAAVGNIKGLSHRRISLYLLIGVLLAIQLYTPAPDLIQEKVVVVMSDGSTEVLDWENSEGEAYYQNQEELITSVYTDYGKQNVNQIGLVHPQFIWQGLFGCYMRADCENLLTM